MIARIFDGAIIETRDDIELEDVPPHKRDNWRPIVGEQPAFDPQWEIISGPVLVIEADRIVRTWTVTRRAPNTGDVMMERDRRLQTVPYGGKLFDFCDGKGSDLNISGAGTMALAAIIGGAQAGNLRWANPDRDFSWLAADNTPTPMDAYQCLAFAREAGVWKERHIFAARALKDMNPIPADFAADHWWRS